MPYLEAGLDVDGCDVSADMIARCRERARRAGLEPSLFVQPMHALDLPRAYRTIFVCGGFGIGSTRDDDAEALARFYAHLEPGGTLALDNEVPYADAAQWPYWTAERRRELPRSWPSADEPRRGSDGNDYALAVRLVALDPLDQRATLQLRARMWRDGELTVEEEHALTLRLYFRDELVLMLERAGFVDVDVQGGHERRAATADDDFIVFVARKPV